MQTKTTKKIVLIVLLAMSAFCAFGQSLITQQTLEEIVSQIKSKVTANHPDSIKALIPLFETYVDALKNKESRLLAESVIDSWAMVAGLSSAYATSNDDREINFAAFIRHYYQQNHVFEGFFNAMTPVFQFYQMRQKTDSIEGVAKEILNEAEQNNARPLLMAASQYMRAWASAARNRRFETMEWLEKAFESSKAHSSEECTGPVFMLYIEMMNQLALGYIGSNRVEKAMEVINVLEPSMLKAFPDNSLQYFQVLWMKTECSSRMMHKKDFELGYHKLKSLFNNLQGVSDEQRSMIQANLAQMEKILNQQTTTEDDLQKVEANKFLVLQNKCDLFLQNQQMDSVKVYANELIEFMESLPQTDIMSYSNAIITTSNIYIAEHDYKKALSLLEHALTFTRQQQVDSLSTRQLEVCYGFVFEKIGNLNEAMKHLNRAKQMYELAGDHSIVYYTGCLANLIDVYYNRGDLAYTKLMLDAFWSHIKETQQQNDVQELLAQGQMLTISNFYALLGYDDYGLLEMEKFLEQNDDKTDDPRWNQTKYLTATLQMKRGEWEKAENLINKIKYTQDYDMEYRKQMGLLMCCASQGKEDTPHHLQLYNKAVHDNIIEVVSAFNPLNRQIFWDLQSKLLVQGNNIVLHMMPDNSLVRQMAYDNALYIKSMQDKQLREVLHWGDIKHILRPNEVAIEFVAIPDNFYGGLSTMYFGALVLRHDNTPQFVKLCCQQDIIDCWQDVLHTDSTLINRLYDIDNAMLYQKLWQPIDSLLHKGDHVFFSLVGLLNNINFSIISTPNGQRLSDLYDLHQLSSTEMIARLKSTRWQCPNQVLAYGGVSYDESEQEMVAAAKPYEGLLSDKRLMAQRALPSTRASVGEWDLPGTRDEAIYIKKVLTPKDVSVKLLLNGDANEESLKALSGRAPDLLHIGTHGFFLSTTDDQWQHRSLFEQANIEGNLQQSQMLQCGLLLAGSRRAWAEELPPIEGVEDGILTAFEISQLDLSQCSLAVLSSCESGLGFINTLTGDIGMKHALKLAGVESIIVSLWQVPDEPTKLLMYSFYDAIAAGLSPRKALTRAQSKVRELYPTAYNWAAFILLDGLD